MKSLLKVLLTSFLFSSCVTFKMYDDEAAKMKLAGYEALVIKINGDKVSGIKVSKEYDKKNDSYFLKIDNNMISASDVYAYQDSKGYYRRYQNTWARLLRKGKINLYYFDTYTYSKDRAVRGYDDHYVFEKGNRELKELTKKEIAEILSDNVAALKSFNDIFKKGDGFIYRQMTLKEIISIVDIYNQ